MAIELSTPDIGALDEVVQALRDWQDDAAPVQLHPGDIGWFWQFGGQRTAAALRTWRHGGRLLAIGLLDGPEVFRMTVAPHMWGDEELARQVVADVSDPQRGILPAGKVSVETPDGTRVRAEFVKDRWSAGEPWTPLRRDLAAPAEQPLLQIEVVRSGRESEFIAVHQSAWGSQRFTDELWRSMAAGLP